MEDEIFDNHKTILQEDANFFTREHEILSKAKNEVMSPEFLDYTDQLQQICENKLAMYVQMANRIKTYCKKCSEEEEIFQKVKTHMWY